MTNGITARGTDNAKVIQIIQTTALAGDGSPENPCRRVVQYWDFDGTLLFTQDPEDKIS